jgi:hypothetical protein
MLLQRKNPEALIDLLEETGVILKTVIMNQEEEEDSVAVVEVEVVTVEEEVAVAEVTVEVEAEAVVIMIMIIIVADLISLRKVRNQSKTLLQPLKLNYK